MIKIENIKGGFKVIKASTIIFLLFSVLIMFGLPAVLIFHFYKKEKISIKAVLVGAVIFFVFQLIIRIPLLGIIQTQPWYVKLNNESILGTALFLGLTAGIFEECGRFLGFKYLLKDDLEWKNGIAYGIGHGGIESIYIGLSMLSYLVFSFAANNGSLIRLVGSKSKADMIVSILANTPSYMFAVSGIERIFALTIQIALSLFVLYGVMNNKYIFLIYAIILHAVVDSPLIILKPFGTIIVEGYVMICAIISLIYIIKSRKIFLSLKSTDYR